MVNIFENEQQVAEAIVKEMMAGLTVAHPVFCLASGNTPAKGYDLFSKVPNIEGIIQKLKIVSLDEWVGIERENKGSCYEMLANDLFSKVHLSPEQIIFYDGMSAHLDEECQRIDDFIAKNPITFSLMGVGMNGHIGLNEPGFPLLSHSSVVPLADKTKEVAQKYFDEKTPLEQGITLGLKQIINSKRVIVVITGAHKAEIVKDIFTSETTTLPAQALLGYDHIDFYLDKAAAQYLDKERGRLV